MTADAKIIHGDCIEVMRGMDAGSVQLVFADPPYNIGIDYGKGKKADKLDEIKYLDWCEKWITNCRKVLAPHGSVWLLFPSQHMFSIANTFHYPGGGLQIRQPIIWRETFGTYRQTSFASGYRILFWCQNPHSPANFYPDAIRVPSARQTTYNDKRANPNGRVPDDVWDVSRLCGTHTSERVDWHPAQLRQWPLERIVKACTKPGDTVLDPFCGSASMGVVCQRLGRAFVGIDENKEYVDRGRERLSAAR